jgi:hypothetical protein
MDEPSRRSSSAVTGSLGDAIVEQDQALVDHAGAG